jgi:hypothetical protein
MTTLVANVCRTKHFSILLSHYFGAFFGGIIFPPRLTCVISLDIFGAILLVSGLGKNSRKTFFKALSLTSFLFSSDISQISFPQKAGSFALNDFFPKRLEYGLWFHDLRAVFNCYNIIADLRSLSA